MLINTNRLKKVEIRLYNEDKVFESFFIAINDQEANQEDFENELMNCIVSLEKRCKTFVKLPKECKFKVLLHTLLYDFSDTSKSEVSEEKELNLMTENNELGFAGLYLD